ncbi:DUF3105 domain-containing protein [Rhodococcus sp. Eu-32]|nr:DUF3105 domain-containing protein [Rhodococcus sp. Eu-32]
MRKTRPTRGRTGARTPHRGVPGGSRVPWSIVGATFVIVLLIGLIGFNLTPRIIDRNQAQRFAPTAEDPDPAQGIEGVVEIEYAAARHVAATQRVAYDKSPPFGGPHDSTWATCTGIVYPVALRNENAVHALEHGAVWVTYDPNRVSAEDIDALSSRVEGKSYMFMSPYPDLRVPITLQSWGHTLELDSSADPRITQFIAALRQNPSTHPENGASCSTISGAFDPDNPPPFDATEPGPDAIPLDDPVPDPAPPIDGGAR